MKRKDYNSPEISVISLDLADVLTASGDTDDGTGGTDLPIVDEYGLFK